MNRAVAPGLRTHGPLHHRVAMIGLLLGSVLSTTAVLAAPASAVPVLTEAELRVAWADDSTVTLGASITLTDCSSTSGELLRSAPTDLAVDGNGFTVTQTCPGQRVAETTGGTLTLGDVTLTGGDLVDDTGGAVGGGGIRVGGALLATRVSIRGNAVTAPAPEGTFAGGGGLWVAGPLTLRQSTVSDNRVVVGASPGIAAGGGILTTGGTIDASTIAHNEAHGTTAAMGGGIQMGSGFSAPTLAALSITNSTIGDNLAASPSGATFGGGMTTSTRVHLLAATVVDNSANTGTNVSADPTSPFRSGEVDAIATVIAAPPSSGASCFFPKGFSTLRHSWVSDGSCSGAPDPSTVVDGGSPELGPLAENGGPTPTMLPSSISPLLDAIPVESCAPGGPAAISTDQRGVARPQGPGCDIGAVELDVGPPSSPTAPSPVTSLPLFTG